MEKRPVDLLDVSLGKSLNGISPSLCGRHVVGSAAYPSQWPVGQKHLQASMTCSSAFQPVGRYALVRMTKIVVRMTNVMRISADDNSN